MGLNAKDFELVLLPGKEPPKKYIEYYEKAYRCWKDTWCAAFKYEMDYHETLFSDNFTRQDEVLALFYQGECLGVTFFRWVDFNQVGTEDDSYFEHWPALTRHALCKNGSRILVISGFTVNLKYHSTLFHGVSLKDLLIGLCYKRFTYAECDAGATALRLQKNMDESVYKVGATALVKDAPYSYGQRVALVAFLWDKIHESTVEGISELVSEIFSDVISLVHPIKLQNIEVKRVA